MDLKELFVSALVSLLVENLASSALSLIPLGGNDEKLKEWKNTLSRIEAVLGDAEDRQLVERSVQLWLHDVQKLAYDIEDFVDDMAIEARRRQMVVARKSSSSPNKLRKLVSGLFSSVTPAAISFNYDMNCKIGDITTTLKRLEKAKNKLGLTEHVGGKSERTGDLRLPSTSLGNPALVYGREEDSAAILKWLLEDTTNGHDGKLRIISIVGMGGIGKTTLAQSLYNNEQINGRFCDKVWVCVTEDFDVLKISKIIYEAVYEKSCEFNGLNKIQEELKQKLSEGRFLLVLDDVWNEDYAKWDLLCAPFRAGAPGSTIIVTTRSQYAAKTMGCKEVYDLKVLSDGDCLSLLAQHALQKPTFNGHPEFKQLGEAISKRCNGLPLAAKSLGGLLRTKGSLEQWEEVSKSKIWEIRRNGIIPALRLSYHHLPPYLKPLFAYCSLFPKSYEFDKYELIMLWMAQGFLKQSGEQKQVEELGCEYFSELLSRSFFQPSTGDKTRFAMHDLNNDLAQYVAGLICVRLDAKMEVSEQYNVSEEARHASFISHTYGDFKKIKAFHAAEFLRTILPIPEKSSKKSYLSSMVLGKFPKLPCLRALSFTGYSINELPKSISSLKHLRYLDCSRTDIAQLPESVCEFYNLQTLLLYGCHKLVRLPTSIQKLFTLRHLDIADTPSLKEMPSGIGMLTHLRKLPKFIVEKIEGRNITELKGLHHLQGTLSIIGMENVMKVQDAIEANLLGKKGLQGLEMKWSCSSGDSQLEFRVLDVLKPQTRLASLKIEFYGGREFPNWVGHHSFCDMVKVRLIGCKNCAYLPPLGLLASLKELVIEGMDGVKAVGLEFFGTDSPNLVAFQSLINLSFIDMGSWKKWSANSTNGAFPRLQDLQMLRCMKLDKVSLQTFPLIGSLKIHGCRETVLRSMVRIASVKKLEVGDIAGLIKLDEEIIGRLGEVENLSVSGCKQLRYLWREEIACQVLQKMKSLSVESCEQLESLGDKDQLLPHNLEDLKLEKCDKLQKMPNWQNNLISLRLLTIKCCRKLQDNLASTTDLQRKAKRHVAMGMAQCSSSGEKQGEHEFSNLEHVSVWECPSLKWFPTGKKLPTTLRYMVVDSCENMEEVEEGENGMSLLESIFIHKWPSLNSLPQGLAHLTRLVIWECWGIESIPERSLPPTLITLWICNCINLTNMLSANEMQSLRSLQKLEISYCKNLENYPSEGCWPPNLKYLSMGEVKKPITEWGLATLPTSLLTLELKGEFSLVSFSEVGTQLSTTTTSLTRLEISGMKDLECLGEGLENLSSLQHLDICKCTKLEELPETLLATLSSLSVSGCPVLEERCKKEKTDYWPKISHIPCLKINNQLLWGL